MVLVFGSLFILAAAATGWLPGPGGIPLFLVGVAILATEFVWAERFRDKILAIIKQLAAHYKTHRIIGTMLLIVATATVSFGIYYFYAHIK